MASRRVDRVKSSDFPYSVKMARGFESKQVESQQADRESRGRDRQAGVSDPVAAAARRTLELARARAEGDLKNARNPAHRAMLEEALASLTAQLERETP